MSKDSLYDLLKYPDSVRSQVAGFCNTSLRQIYQGTIRQQLVALGYTDRTITLGENAAADRILAFAEWQGNSVVDTFNAMLERAITNLPDTATDLELRAGVQSFLDAVSEYNTATLIPFNSRWAAAGAKRDFYQRNEIEVDYEFDPPEVADPDNLEESCTAALSRCTVTDDGTLVLKADAVEDFSPPEHQNCPHELIPLPPADDVVLPDEADLWTGEQDEGDAGETAAFSGRSLAPALRLIVDRYRTSAG